MLGDGQTGEQGQMFDGKDTLSTPPKTGAKPPQKGVDFGLFGTPKEPEAEQPSMFDTAFDSGMDEAEEIHSRSPVLHGVDKGRAERDSAPCWRY